MKVEKVPEEAFVIKFEITGAEARDLITDLDLAAANISFENTTKEFHEALKKLVE